MEKAPVIGIDFGTCKLCVGVFQNGNVEIIPNDNTERTTPSYFAFNGDKKLVGNDAKNQMRANPENTIFNIKRLIGHCFDEKIIQEDKKFFPFELIKDSNSKKIKIKITYNNQHKEYYIEEIIASEFQKLKQIASQYLGKEVKGAVIGVPNYFNYLQREIIRDSAHISGLNVIRLVNETSLAALAYEMNRQNEKKETNLIFDFGGGFLNVSIYDFEETLVEAKAINGNIHLGGEDIDNRLMEYCIGEFRRNTNIDISTNNKALRRLKKECEKAKKSLSSSKNVTIDIEDLANGKDLLIDITRDQFENICSDIFKKIILPIENLLKDAKINRDQIDEIILVGGSSKIPKVQSMLLEYFNKKELNKSLNPEEAVAMGAAIQAAIMAAVKNDIIDKIILMDIIPHSIGIETVGGVMNFLIPRNSNIPLKKTQNFTTYEDNQPIFKVNVYEGERALVKDNHLLGKFILEGIPPMPRGQPQIEITFDIDANSTICVSAVEKSSGAAKKITNIPEEGRLKKEDKEKLILEFEEEKEKGTPRYLAKIKLENYCNKLNRNIEDIKLTINEILVWINNNPKASEEEINSKREELNYLLKE